MERLKKIRSKFRFSKSFAIIGHVKPDGDAICSALAFKNWIELNYKKRNIDIFFETDKNGIDKLYEPIIADTPINVQPKKKYDVVIVLDCPNLSRTGKYSNIAKKRWILNVDHHANNEMFGAVNVAPSKASSTGEILWFLLNQLSDKNGTQITQQIAKYLYTAILTDTNCFTSTTTTSRTHKVVSNMLYYNFNSDDIRNYFFANTKSKTFLLTKALKSLTFYNNDTISLMRLYQEDFERTNCESADSLGIVDHGLQIAGVKIAAIIIEKAENEFKVSIRARKSINIIDLAKSFNGGGHDNIAAFDYSGNIKDLVNEFIKRATELIHSLPNSEDDKEFIF